MCSEAINAFSNWAKKFFLTKKEAQASVVNVKAHEQLLYRSTWSGNTRTIKTRQRITSSRSRKLETPYNPKDYDPWDAQNENIESETQQLVECDKCLGQKKTECPSCSGSGEITCDICGGSGHVASKSGNRLVNCRSCRGSGSKRCRCRTGSVKCVTCDGKGKVERWLEIEEKPFVRTRLLSVGAEGYISPWTRNGTTEIHPEYAMTTPEKQWEGGSVDGAPQEYREWLRKPELDAAASSLNDRITSIKIEVFRRQINTIRYRICGANGEIAVAGPKYTVFEQGTSRLPLLRRLSVLGTVAIVALMAGVGFYRMYIGKHVYFQTTLNASILFYLAFIVPFVSIPTCCTIMLAKFRQRRKLVGYSALPLLILSILITILMNTGYPGIEKALGFYKAGQYTETEEVAQALVDLNIDSSRARSLLDEVRLEKIFQTSDWKKALELSNAGFHYSQNTKKSADYIRDLAVSQIDKLQERKEYDSADNIIQNLPQSIQEDEKVLKERRLSSLYRLGRCVDDLQTSCFDEQLQRAQALGVSDSQLDEIRIRTDRVGFSQLDTLSQEAKKLTEIDDQIAVYRKIKDVLSFLKVASTHSIEPPFSEENIDVQLDRLEAQRRARIMAEEAKRVREQKAAELRMAREKARAERRLAREKVLAERRRRAEESRSRRTYSSARCCDGTLSPTCGCGGGRGCCSHHGGVCGCN